MTSTMLAEISYLNSPLVLAPFTLAIACIFYTYKTKYWAKGMFLHENGYVYAWKLVQKNSINIFQTPFTILGNIFFGYAYSRSQRFGNITTDIILTLNGIFTCIMVYLITENSIISPAAMSIYYVYMISTCAIGDSVQPEYLIDFFVFSGIIISIYALSIESPLLIFIGAFIGGLSLLVKINSINSIATCILILSVNPSIEYLVPCLLGISICFMIFLITLACSIYFKLESISHFLSWIKADTKARYQKKRISTIISELFYALQPVMMLFVFTLLYISMKLTDSYDLFMVYFSVSSLAIVFIRKATHPTYFSAFALPISFFSAKFIYELIYVNIYNVFVVILLFSILYFQVINDTGYKERRQRIERMKREASLMNGIVIKKMRDIVKSKDPIFGNTHLPQYYTELETTIPEHFLLVFGYQMHNIIKSENAKTKLLKFFCETLPLFLVIDPNRTFDIKYFEKSYGAKYEIVFYVKNFFVYRLTERHPQKNDIDLDILFGSTSIKRCMQDKEAIDTRALTLVDAALIDMENKNSKKALNKLKIAWFLTSNTDIGKILKEVYTIEKKEENLHTLQESLALL